jgi:hypothetical protein
MSALVSSRKSKVQMCRWVRPKFNENLQLVQRLLGRGTDSSTRAVGHYDAIKISIFWDVMLCSPLKVNRRFGGTCRLNIQG